MGTMNSQMRQVPGCGGTIRPNWTSLLLKVLRPDMTSGTASGYLIAPRLVLTAAHAVEPKDEVAVGVEVETMFPGSGLGARGRVIWVGDEHLDAALVLLDKDEDASITLAEVGKRRSRWGVLTGTRPGVDATAMGFPRVLRDSDGTRVSDQLNGTINPGVAFGDQYDLLVTGPPPEANDAHPSPWAGLSGAALFSRDLIIGVVRADLPAWGHGRLSAVPLHRLLQDSEFSAHLARHECPIWAESVELPLLDRPFSRLDSPASLLRADNEVVEFHGRKELLENLNAWCVDKENLSLRLITGPGGQGKTRLARQLVSGLRKHRWIAGFLTDAEFPSELMNRLADSTWPVLLVVDYAEGRTDLARRLVHAVGNVPQSKIRLLLLARSAGDWWKDLSRELRALCNLMDPYPLPPVDDSIQRRKAAYDDAVRDLAAGLSRSPAGGNSSGGR